MSIGVTDQEQWARKRMLDTLCEVPLGGTVCGWVIRVAGTPSTGNDEHYEFVVKAERDASGAVQVTEGGGGA
jgi:hypothetical protein